MKKALERVPRIVMEWAITKKGLLELVVLAVMSLYDSGKTKVKV